MRVQVIIGLLLAFTILLLVGHFHQRKVVCSNFWSQEKAQSFYQENSMAKLDRDKDGIACEHLP